MWVKVSENLKTVPKHIAAHLVDDVILQGEVRLAQVNTLPALLSSCSCQSINQSISSLTLF